MHCVSSHVTSPSFILILWPLQLNINSESNSINWLCVLRLKLSLQIKKRWLPFARSADLIYPALFSQSGPTFQTIRLNFKWWVSFYTLSCSEMQLKSSPAFVFVQSKAIILITRRAHFNYVLVIGSKKTVSSTKTEMLLLCLC